MNHSLGLASTIGAWALVEVDLLRCVRLVVNCLHVLRVHCCVLIVEHLLHCRKHRLIDVTCCGQHDLVCIRLWANYDVVTVFLTHHTIRLLNDHASVFDGLVVGVVRMETVVASVRGASCWRNRAGVDIRIDNCLILLMMMWLLITWITKILLHLKMEKIFLTHRLSWDLDSDSLLSENREQLLRDRLRWYHSGDSHLKDEEPFAIWIKKS